MTWENRLRPAGCLLGFVSTRLASFVPSNGRSHNSSGSELVSISRCVLAQGQSDQIHRKDGSIDSRSSPQTISQLFARLADRSVRLRRENAILTGQSLGLLRYYSRFYPRHFIFHLRTLYLFCFTPLTFYCHLIIYHVQLNNV